MGARGDERGVERVVVEKDSKQHFRKKKGEEVPLSIGQDLLLQFPYSPEKFKSKFVGRYENDFLIVQLPLSPGIRDRILDGNSLVVRYVEGGAVYGFVATILGHALKPRATLFLTVPIEVDTVSLRECDRVETFIPAECVVDEKSGRCRILDLSCGGCRVVVEAGEEGEEPPTAGPEKPVTLVFSLHGKDDITAVTGKVVKVFKDKGHTSLAVKFDDGQEALDDVNAFIDGMLALKS